MDARDEVLAAILHPLHRPTETHRQVPGKHLIGIKVGFRSEPPADLRHDQPQIVLGNAQQLGELGPQQMGKLARGPDGQLSGRHVVVGCQAARLHEQRQQALVDQAQLHYPVGSRDGGLNIACLSDRAKRDVAVHRFVDQRAVCLKRLLDVYDHRQWVVVHLDEINRVAGLVRVLGHHTRDGLANTPHGVRRQQRQPRLRHALHRRKGGDVVLDLTLEIGRREHCDHAGRRLGRAGIYARQTGVRLRTPHERRVQRTGNPHVVNVGGPALDQARVLAPADGCPDELGQARRCGRHSRSLLMFVGS